MTAASRITHAMDTALSTDGSNPATQAKRLRNAIITRFAALFRILRSLSRKERGAARNATLAPETAIMCSKPASLNASFTPSVSPPRYPISIPFINPACCRGSDLSMTCTILFLIRSPSLTKKLPPVLSPADMSSGYAKTDAPAPFCAR